MWKCIQNGTIILWVVLATILRLQIATTASIDQPSASSSSSFNGLFAADLLRKIAKTRATENVLFSPVSIQAALAMTYLGADGKTAEELVNGIHLTSSDKNKVGEDFAQILSKHTGQTQLNITNRMFVNSDDQIQPDFNRVSEKYFNSKVEAVNFKDKPLEAIETINNWVENETNKTIKKLMQPGSVNSDTSAIIANVVFFQGIWQQTFIKERTRKIAFWINKNESVNVDAMVATNRRLKSGDFPELDATVVEIPFKDSDMSLMFILPSKNDSLVDLESKLSSTDINGLSSKMGIKNIHLMIPKFKIEFSTDLSSVLKEIGIRSLFEKADLPGILKLGLGSSPTVSEFQHKAYIEINEAGAGPAEVTPLRSGLRFVRYNKYFKVNRPFVFAIKDSNVIYCLGHVAKF